MNPLVYCLEAVQPEASVIALGLRRRDLQLLDGLVVEYQHRLLRYLTGLCGDPEWARDLFQETWLRVLERGHLYDGRRPFATWLYTVARNLTRDQARARRHLSLDEKMEEDPGLEPADLQPCVWEVLARRDQAHRIQAATAQLPSPWREAIILRFQEEMSLEEISMVTSAPPGTVKSRIHRALALLAKKLKEIPE